jgi:hypothetical protein
MPEIAINSKLSSPQRTIAPRLLTVMRGYAERAGFALTVDLGFGRAAMSVPVRLELTGGESATSVPFQLGSRERTDWFPVFRGEASVEEWGALGSRLRLVGNYEVPLGALGTMVNRRVLGGVAERSLRVFLDGLRDDVRDEIHRSEAEIRQRERQIRAM